MELSELTDKAIDCIIDGLCDDLACDHPKLNDWERKFVISVEDQWRRNRFLTIDQKLKLGQVWDKL